MNITTELQKDKVKVIDLPGDEAVKQVKLLEQGDQQEHMRIARALGYNNYVEAEQKLGEKIVIEKLDKEYNGDVYTELQIKALARKYNLRFLKVGHYRGRLDNEVISKIIQFNRETKTEITTGALQENFFILAPESCFNLKEVDKVVFKQVDPAIFYNIGDGKFKMIHQWGSDFNLRNRIEGFKWSSPNNHYIYIMIKIVLVFAILFALLFKFTDTSYWFLCLAILVPIIGSAFSYNTESIGTPESIASSAWGRAHYHEWKWNRPVTPGKGTTVVEVNRVR